MFLDGLEDAYDEGRLMGTFAEDTAEAYQFTRAAQDAYATTSLERARRACDDGTFQAEIVPVIAEGSDNRHDACPRQLLHEQIPQARLHLLQWRNRGSQLVAQCSPARSAAHRALIP
jgi:acetyl-CoA C-acetyltransferase